MRLVALAAAAYLVRMFAITAVYHRYFSHRSYKTSRVFQLLLAFLGTHGHAEGPALVGRGTTACTTSTPTPSATCTARCDAASGTSHMGWWLGREHEDDAISS